MLSLFTLIAVYLLRRSSWLPVVPLRIARPRSVGRVIRAAGRMHVSRWRLFIGIGVLTVPVSLLIAAEQGALLSDGDIVGVPLVGEGGAPESSWPECPAFSFSGRPSCWC